MNEEDTIQLILRRRAEALANRQQNEQQSAKLLPFLLVDAGNGRYGIELSYLLETAPYGECTPVPGAQNHLLGITSCRGELKAVFDLAYWLENETSRCTSAGFVLFLKKQPDVGFRVRHVLDIILCSEVEIEISRIKEGAQCCYAHFQGVSLLDPEKLLSLVRRDCVRQSSLQTESI